MTHGGSDAEGLHPLEKIRGFTIQASDGEIGQIVDGIFTLSDWTIRYLVVDTGNWLPGKKVITSTAWIDRIDWNKQCVCLSITCEQVKGSPELNELDQLDRKFEEHLFSHYQRPGYWIQDSPVDEASWESFPASDPPATW